MPPSPEQECALGYIRRRGAEAALAEIKARVERTCAPFEQVVEDVSPEVARSTSDDWPRIATFADELVVKRATLDEVGSGTTRERKILIAVASSPSIQ